MKQLRLARGLDAHPACARKLIPDGLKKGLFRGYLGAT